MCCSSVVRFGDIAFLTRVAPCSRQLISFVFFLHGHFNASLSFPRTVSRILRSLAFVGSCSKRWTMGSWCCYEHCSAPIAGSYPGQLRQVLKPQPLNTPIFHSLASKAYSKVHGKLEAGGHALLRGL